MKIMTLSAVVLSISLSANPDASPPDTSRSTIFTAVQELLGLRLEPGKAPAEVMVIDHLERANAN
jgi:uncharacterized protein (TIGR03435 family)